MMGRSTEEEDDFACGIIISVIILVAVAFICLHDTGTVTEPLTFKTRIICILTVGAEQNVIARVQLTTHVKGVERLCQVPPGVFQVGEKVRISVRNVLNVLRV